ncbi:hypothetical protein [Streptomyces mirabilis]
MLGELGLGGSLRRRSSIGKAYHATARLIVCRVKRLNPKSVPEGQAELFGAWRHHVIFTDSPFVLAQAEPMHREHAQVEQVFADLEDSALAHLPSGKFTANAAWLTLAATAYNLTRAAGHLASVFHARARTGTTARPPRRAIHPTAAATAARTGAASCNCSTPASTACIGAIRTDPHHRKARADPKRCDSRPVSRTQAAPAAPPIRLLHCGTGQGPSGNGRHLAKARSWS